MAGRVQGALDAVNEPGSVDMVKGLERMVAADPSNIGALSQLASAYWRSGQLELAARCLSQSIELNPDDPNPWNNRGICFQALGRQDEALESFQKAVELAPRSFPFLLNFGKALVSQRRWQETVGIFARALEMQPNSLDCLAGLAEALQTTGDIAERDRILNRLITLDGLNLEQRITRASIFHNLDLSKTALDLIEEVLRTAPGDSGATFLKGMILIRLGRHDESVEAMEDTIRARPTFAPPYFFLCQSKKFDEGDRPLIDQMEQLAASFSGPPSELAMLHHALGWAYNGLKSYGQAMQHFDESNAISKQTLGLRFDPEAYQQDMDDIIDTFSREEIEKGNAVASRSEKPVFIVGMPRSGTTLTESILAAHPQVVAAGELLYWQSQGSRAVTFRSHFVHVEAAQFIGRKYLELIETIGPDAARVVDKNLFNFLHAGLIAKVFPRAKFIHCVRHPVDTCLSFWMSSFNSPPHFSFDRANIVSFYRQYERLVHHWKDVLGPDRWLDVHYEHLVTNQEQESRRLVKFIGLDWDPSCLQPEKAARVVSTASHWQARQPVYNTSVERWRRYEPWLGEFRELLADAAVS